MLDLLDLLYQPDSGLPGILLSDVTLDGNACCVERLIGPFTALKAFHDRYCDPFAQNDLTLKSRVAMFYLRRAVLTHWHESVVADGMCVVNGCRFVFDSMAVADDLPVPDYVLG